VKYFEDDEIPRTLHDDRPVMQNTDLASEREMTTFRPAGTENLN
jgi:hypothetical protein